MESGRNFPFPTKRKALRRDDSYNGHAPSNRPPAAKQPTEQPRSRSRLMHTGATTFHLKWYALLWRFLFFRLITWDGLLNVRITTRIITPHSERIPGGSKKEGQIGAHLCPSLLSCFSRTVVTYTIANKWAVEIGTLCSLTLEFFLRYIL